MDGVNSTEGEAEEEGRGQLQEGNMAQRVRASVRRQHRPYRTCEFFLCHARLLRRRNCSRCT